MKTPGSVRAGIIVLFFLNFILAFITAIAAPFGNVWNYHYEWASMWGNMMNFSAYLIMGIPAGKMLKRIGYKKSLIVSLIVGAAGITIQILSGFFGASTPVFQVGADMVCLNYVLYLSGAFICGFCVCILNVVVCPMMFLLAGGGERGTAFNQFSGTVNSFGQTVTPILVGALIGTVTAETSMIDVVPLLYIALGVLLVSTIVIAILKVAEPHEATSEKYKSSPWVFRHFVLGAIAIFFYTAIEVGIPAELNFYITGMSGEGGAAAGGAVAAVYWLLMMVGRGIGGTLNGKVPTRMQLKWTVIAACILIMIAIFLPSSMTVRMPGFSVESGITMFSVPLSALPLVLCGLCTSVMWVCIFTLSIDGLGKYAEEASGIFMMMIFGGGVMPLIQDTLAKHFGVMNSYWFVIAMLLYLLFYSVSGYKKGNYNIKVD